LSTSHRSLPAKQKPGDQRYRAVLVLALSAIFAFSSAAFINAVQPSAGPVGPSAAGDDCPAGTVFIAKYTSDLRFDEGTDRITFSDVVRTNGEVTRFDFTSTVPISFVFVKAGSPPSCRRLRGSRSRPSRDRRATR